MKSPLHCLALALLVCTEIALCQPTTRIVLYADGSASVTHVVEVETPCVFKVTLLGEPEYLLVLSGDAHPVPFNRSGDSLSFWVLDKAVVTYDVEELATEREGVWTLRLSVQPGVLAVTLPRGSVLVYFDPPPDAVRANDTSLTLEYELETEGLVELEYILLPGPALGRETERGFAGWLFVAAVGLIALLAAVAWLYARRRRRPLLTEEEEEIIKFLKARGGWAYQSEIRDYLGLPTTTVWRRIKRLSELGLVVVERTPRGNKVALKGRVLFRAFRK